MLDRMHLARDACECICNDSTLLLLAKQIMMMMMVCTMWMQANRISLLHFGFHAYFWKLNLHKTFSFALWQHCNQIIVLNLLVVLIKYDIGSMPRTNRTRPRLVEWSWFLEKFFAWARSDLDKNVKPHQHFQPNYVPSTRTKWLATLL